MTGIGIVILLLIILISGLKIDNEYQRSVIFRLGRYHGIKGPGMYWIFPVIDQRRQVDMRTITVDIESQETVTKDSVTVKVNAVLYFKINDPKKAILEVRDYTNATYQASLTALRNVIGQHNLDEILKDRETINKAIRTIVDQITDQWGLNVEYLEMKDVEIPQSMQRAMAKEAEAIREKRARMIKAEGEYDASAKLKDAARFIAENPAALELRRMQMISEVGAEQNTTTIVLMPSDFVTLAKSISESLQIKSDKEKK